MKSHNERIAALLDQAAEHRRRGRAVEELHALDRILNIRRDTAEVHVRRAEVLLKLRAHDEAIGSAERALVLDPAEPRAWYAKGVALAQLSRADDALSAFEAALALDPAFAPALENKALALAELGRMEEAAAAGEAAVRLTPGRVRAYMILAQLRRFSADGAHLPAMETLAQDDAGLSSNDRLDLNFALGRAYEAAGDFRRAFESFSQASGLKRLAEDYDESAALGQFERTAKAFTTEVLRRAAGAGDPSRAPIFILGMPRSGTTLAEQILASHPKVHGAGEIEAFQAALHEFASRDGFSETPETLATLGLQTLTRIGAAYMRRVRPLLGKASRLVDKSIPNYHQAGLIHMALPNARFIHVHREPLDACLSCFMAIFAGNHPYSYDLAELGRYYRAYERLMAHWRQILPPRVFLEVRYEDVVADLEGQARRMLAHCGLEWDPACLAFHETERPVRTSSTMQVRRPIYSSSVGRWKAYEPWLGPLIEALAAP